MRRPLLTAALALTLAMLGNPLRVPQAQAQPEPRPSLRAGAAVADISPTHSPVIVNAMFTERSATQTVDRLHARALVIQSGPETVAIAVVDTCMMPRDLIDRAKDIAHRRTGIPVDRILISATHTHSAPAAMGCLGSREDPRYAAFLPGPIAEAIVAAHRHLAPAEVAWTSTNAWHHTFNRRWIRRPDRLLNDPFGQPTVRAHMHPGHVSPDAVGPSGPVDPGLSLVAFRSLDGHPIALLANYSQHYYGSPLLSSDYYGRFAQHLSQALAPSDAAVNRTNAPAFVPIMSQGTSGDLMWMDYGAPAREIGYDAYAREIADLVASAYRSLHFRRDAPLRMAESRLKLDYRTPGPDRLAWARTMAATFAGQLPQTLPQIYALEALHLHQRQSTELVLQALRLGDVGIAALPNEVFALTGLKLKAQSPLPLTFNIELANGAEGYIPPPEQHHLGGYTTWPARTAGLETQAEPRIVETLLSLLERVAERPRQPPPQAHGPYAQAILHSHPDAYWRLEEMVIPQAADATPHGRNARFELGLALHLPGPGSGEGVSPAPALMPSAFSGPALINRAVHCAGGRLRATLPGLGSAYSVEFWFWNGLAPTHRAVTGYLFSRGVDGDPQALGDHLGIGGTTPETPSGRLFVFNGNQRQHVLAGRTPLRERTWYHVALVRDGARVRVHLNGDASPEIEGDLESTLPFAPNELFFGGRSDHFAGLEGRIDEVAVYARPLAVAEITAHTQASGLPLARATPPTRPTLASPPLSPQESLTKLHLSPGFKAELAAAEPLVLDPVAIDWDAEGRLWVVEMADYPLGLDGHGQPGGRVRVLTDTNADGVYDQSRVFAEGLRFPNGLLIWRDGVLVTAAPEVLFLKDSDGDGTADVREVLLSGFLEGNQQLRVNGLRWGVDNWVYCAAGGHHRGHGAGTRVRSHRNGTEIALGSRDFRFRPDTGEIEPESGPSQFGRNPDDWGHWFGTQNSWPLWHYVLADGYLRRNPHIPAPDPVSQVVRPMNPQVFPASTAEKRFHSFNEAGHFTSACAGSIYRDELVFPRGDTVHALTCEPFHNLVHRAVVRDDGVSFSAARDLDEVSSEWLASEDRWFRPVMTRTGPDGAVWVVDMYRYMIEHPEWLPPEGRAELLPHYRAGDDRGRLYRITRTDAPPRARATWSGLDAPRLVAHLASPNGWVRDHVQQRLLWLADPAAVPPLRQLASSSPAPLGRLHALWTLHGLRALPQDLLRAALADPHPRVRENALRMAETGAEPETIRKAARLITDPDDKVRLQLALSLGAWSDSDAGDALVRLAGSAGTNAYLLGAVLSSAVPHAERLIAAYAASTDPAALTLFEPLCQLTLGLQKTSWLEALLTPILQPTAPGSPFRTDQYLRLTRLLNVAARSRLAPGILSQATPVFHDAQRRLADTTIPAPERFAAAELLLRHPDLKGDAIPFLAAGIAPQSALTFQQDCLRALQGSDDARAGAALLDRWSTAGASLRPALLDALLSRADWTRPLAQALDAGSIAPTAFDAARRGRLLRHADPAVRAVAEKVFGAGLRSPRAEVVSKYRDTLQKTGDAGRGAAHYTRLCATCHRRGDEGRDIGPDLKSVIPHAPEKLLVNILDPNADVQPGFHAFQATLSGGEELYGIIAAETGNSVLLKLADGSVRTLLRSQIESLRGSDLSLMPEGLEAGLTSQDLADLIAFLKTP